MTELEKVQTIAKDSVEKLASRQSEPSWLLDKRLAAWESYYKTPMPSPADEGWKRLDIDAFDLSCLVTANIPAATRQNDFSSSPEWLSVALAGFKDLSGVVYQNVQKPGFYTLKPSLSSRGVICCDINTAKREHADKIKPYLDCESKE